MLRNSSERSIGVGVYDEHAMEKRSSIDKMICRTFKPPNARRPAVATRGADLTRLQNFESRVAIRCSAFVRPHLAHGIPLGDH